MTDRPTRRSARSLNEEAAAARWDLDDEEAEALVPRADPPAEGVAYADIPRRGVAFVLDMLIIQMASTMILQAFGFVVGATLLTGNGLTDQHLGAWLGFAVPTVIIALLEAVVFVFFWRVYRASPGQLVLGLLTVRAADGQRLSKRRATLRWAVTFLPGLIIAASTNLSVVWVVIFGKSSDDQGAAGLGISLPVVWFLVILASMVIDRRGRGLHDRLAGSVVVKREG